MGLGRSRAGNFVRQHSGYSAFLPKPLPPDPLLSMTELLQTRLAVAERHLGRLDIAADLLPNPDRFVYMYVRQEAVLSSQIEGTQASLADLLEFESAEQDDERSIDVNEVLNYTKALNHGLKLLEKLPLSTRLMCDVHRVLMQDVRGGESTKTPGEFRRTQNWIGGSAPANARFVPPPVHEMLQAMSDLEKYINQSKATPSLVEIGMIHAHFETIHPFIDGNGRLGRMLITFLLCSRRILSKPLLYLSYFLKLNQQDYYDRLQAIRTEGDWESWIDFFLNGVARVAEEATERAKLIRSLIEIDQRRIREGLGRRAATALDLFDLIIQQPVVSSAWIVPRLQVSQPTVDKLLAEFVKLKVLRETTGRQRGRRFAYSDYLALFQVKYE
jgi:Fic family protein